VSALLRIALSIPLVAGCAAMPEHEAPGNPYVLVLGTAQDGGLPQIGCRKECCEAARRDPERRRLVTSILVVDPRSGTRFLVDASPDLPEQIELAKRHPPARTAAGPRPPLVDGIFLTHAHIGHYLGLAHLGREVYGAKDTPLHASARMAAYLRENGPWSLLVETGAVRLEILEPDRPVELGEDLSIVPITVPHREEYSDTFGFVVRGPNRALLYVSDIDKWENWDRRVEDVLAGVDVALLDGTFFDEQEVPGRLMAEIPHPFIVESIERFSGLAPEERGKVLFTHMNHSNPAAVPESPEASAIRAAGMAVARDGQRIEL